MPTIHVSEQTYQRLTNQANMKCVSVEELLKPVIEQMALRSAGDSEELSYEQWKARFDQHMTVIDNQADHYPSGHRTDVSRESIYDGCGE